MTGLQEHRLLLAALAFAQADADLRAARRDHRRVRSDPDGTMRAHFVKARRKAREKLLRAAGNYRQQQELDIKEASAE